MNELLKEYQQGADQLADAIAGMTKEQLDARPVAGKWSTRQVVCHLVDFEPVYADRMKWVLVEDNPLLPGGDPDDFAAKLAYDVRDLANEIELMRTIRLQMAAILKSISAEDWQRTGRHSRDGELTLETLLRRITGHVPHHIQTIQEKKAALGI